MHPNLPVIPGHAAGMSPEPMNSTLPRLPHRSLPAPLWFRDVLMGSGLAASLRPGMTAAQNRKASPL